MELNRDAQIDTSQVEDDRGASGGGGIGGLPIPIGRSGGGIVGLIVTVLLVLVGGGFGVSQLVGGGGGQSDNSTLNQECSSANPDRTGNLDCQNTLYINSIQAFWTTELPQVFNVTYQKADTEFFTGQTQTGCGVADSGAGPFYCPEDQKVHIDLTFYQQLTDQFGAKGQFAQPYVLAHEYGHRIQDLVGTMAKVNQYEQQGGTTANRYSVMLELQADCYAGVWAAHATQTKDAAGRPIFTSVTQQDVTDAVNAAGAVGDDAIQKQAGQQVNPDTFTHGSSAQREQWVSQGYKTGDPKQCDTFGNALR
jgi:predicted metalloprotease